jgi:hypothetical protein
MAARLGEVLFWVACAIGAPLIMAGVTIPVWDPKDPIAMGLILFAVPGLLSLLFGRACLYVLAGR